MLPLHHDGKGNFGYCDFYPKGIRPPSGAIAMGKATLVLRPHQVQVPPDAQEQSSRWERPLWVLRLLPLIVEAEVPVRNRDAKATSSVCATRGPLSTLPLRRGSSATSPS